MSWDQSPEERARADDRRARAVDHVVRAGGDPDEFDDRFWASMTGEQRVDVLWSMVQDWLAMNGRGDEEPRLQRSVERVTWR